MSLSPAISAIIPTFNRAGLLAESLASLVDQSLPKDRYEVVVIDDGSPDETSQVCRDFSDRLPLKYQRIANSGISAAKNLGIFTASAPLLLFFDDDDVAGPDLLKEHVLAHESRDDDRTAILGYTTWSPRLTVNEVMHYVTEVSQLLFAYRDLVDGQELDYTYFWGGRTSCRRSLLTDRGIFRQEFRFGCEDIELGYRLSKFGLRVFHSRKAIQYMNRAISFEEFCRRCEKQGRSQVLFARQHSAPEIQQYCETAGAGDRWRTVQPHLASQVRRVAELEEKLGGDLRQQQSLRRELHDVYGRVFRACKDRGIVGAIDTERK